ncbi:hypothetical protein CC1G_12943 [Coprinopsis cinerea okayama7|uniref:CxC2-like cysteine cluster KDZ transposase-associated domain-containing protein n=1 Tax=Coprinopsis cinerea (strain Okayama-7 / 130 / ATCC MYA-4618 / FGSC 9003) TaxID=240176 RepID=A8PAI2_COPC7|nr:hypothetical protein CC1G_12943 [Coprinopsis cinerea okayama7\|eukprot:XP_001839992.2 hypothetical protein CC1G_12943 [Coprinopsis cinerea okayama7\
MGFGSRTNITHIVGAHKVRPMRATLVTDKKGRKRVKLKPTIPSPQKRPPSPSTSAKRRRLDEDNWTDDEGGGGVYIPFGPQEHVDSKARTKDSNDYMEEWIPKQMDYLDALIRREVPPDCMDCSCCSARSSAQWWRCTTCPGAPLYCEDCCLKSHQLDPFHRVLVWTGSHFRPSWLWKCGVYIDLCQSRKCPRDSDVDVDSPLESNEGINDWYNNDDFSFGSKPPGRSYRGMKVVTVVHQNGIHHLPFHFCTCVEGEEDEYQLLRMGFYPATSTDVRTVFTFTMLDDYLLETIECYTSTYHYYSKLKRATNEPFPDTVPDRTRELRRVGRQWRRLKEMKRYGFGHLGVSPGKGQLALFCAACPQPGVNLQDGWENDPDDWKYTRSFVADGNFTCVHRKRESGSVGVALKHGEGYMTNPERYAKHLAEVTEVNETPTCHEHRAIADKSKVRKGLDVTGIGAVACMRHGAFAPGSVVDFQKGERQANMDYSLSEALKYTSTDQNKRVIFAYDINCQFSKNLRKRMSEGRYLKLREDLAMVYGIGLFHVHAHQESCLARYSLSFIKGAGNSAGEILESLWAVVNEVARVTSTMTLGHRMEVLDAIFGDINWKKMLGLTPSICKNWLKARKELAAAKEALAVLSESASEAQRKEWQQQLDEMNVKRGEDVAVMDALNAKIVKPPTMAKVRTTLMEIEKKSGRGVGVTSWLSIGMKIQESQISLKSFIRSLPKELSDEQALEVEKRREQLYNDIDSFYEAATHLFPDADLESLKCDLPPSDDVLVDGEDEEDNPFSLTHNQMEEVRLPLPSCLSSSISSTSIELAGSKELKLRLSQADDALEGIRNDIGHKSYLYRSNVRLAEGKKQKTRGYAAVKNVNDSLKNHVKVYNQARWAMRRLGADAKTLQRYRPIAPGDTKAVTAIYNPNARGQRNKSLSWIWTMDVAGDSAKSEYLEELYRVNWLRARSRFDRWREEYKLLRSEMDWILNFFSYKEAECKSWALRKEDSPGHVAYALRQADMWHLLYAQADKAFQKTLDSVKEGK